MKVRVKEVRIPAGSTIGYGKAETEDGTEVEWVGDHRPMRHLAEALLARDVEDDEEFIEIELEEWQILDKTEAPRAQYEAIFETIQESTPRPIMAMVVLLVDETSHAGIVGLTKVDDHYVPLDPETMLEVMRMTIEELTS